MVNKVNRVNKLVDERVSEQERPTREDAEEAVRVLLRYIGEDLDREDLRRTPERVIKAWDEWFSGYSKDPVDVTTLFQESAEGVNQLVVVHNCPVVSFCAHHLAIFTGYAQVGYIPKGKVLGLSKIPRIVDIFSRRLQTQERLTNQIADAIQEVANPIGVGVYIKAEHSCMSSRGVKIHGSCTSTSALRGALYEEPSARAEFMEAIRSHI